MSGLPLDTNAANVVQVSRKTERAFLEAIAEGASA
jgi:hypothetical protein